jgi:hypothetical protein
VREAKASGGAFSVDSAPGFGDGVSLKNGTVAFISASGTTDYVYAAAEGQSPGSPKATIGSYTVSAIALNPTGMDAFFIGQSKSMPYQMYLMQCPLAGGVCSPLGNAVESPGSSGLQTQGLLVNTNNAFWIYAGGSSSASLNRYSFATNSVTTISTLATGKAMAIDATNIYWTATPLDTIYYLPLSFPGSATPQFLANSGMPIYGMASDGTNVYFGTENPSASSSLYYVPVSGGTPKLMYTSPTDPNRIDSWQGPVVTAGGAVYWVDASNDCVLMNRVMGIAVP